MSPSSLSQPQGPQVVESTTVRIGDPAPLAWLHRIRVAWPESGSQLVPVEQGVASGAPQPQEDVIVEHERLDARTWAERIARQPLLQSARELSGLTELELNTLEQAVKAAPAYPRTDVYRHATPLGVLAVGAGALGLAADHLANGGAESGALLAISTAIAGVGLMMLCLGSVMSFRLAPLRQAYARLATMVSEIGEHHPWLYETAQLMGSKAAEGYRRRIRGERGVVRGVDCYMMREIASIDEQSAQTESARSVRERVQALAHD